MPGRRRRNLTYWLSLLAAAGIGASFSIGGLAGASSGASAPPFGSDLPFKAYGPLVAGDGGPPLECGEERWPIKTLSDAAAASVNSTAVDTTVNALRVLAVPTQIKDGVPRLSPVELTTYRITARLVRMKREDDMDIHLVVADPSDSNATMIVEFPDVRCEGAIDSARRPEMQSARQAFQAACGMPTTTFKDLSGNVTLTGVGFFDLIHGQSGVAPNGIELHPVLSVVSITCGAGTESATPTQTTGTTPVTSTATAATVA